MERRAGTEKDRERERERERERDGTRAARSTIERHEGERDSPAIRYRQIEMKTKQAHLPPARFIRRRASFHR